ncbi:MAG: aldo/keto reductase, partial [Gammaproteobacteria bacterium]|nr:aldo/keto reductase [Gammaproteobacteria bacterium]
GINFFDTADQYNGGRAEAILGRLMKGERDELIIATKCFNATAPDINARGTSRRHMSRAVEASLKRLDTDRIDVFFLHHLDRRTPIEEQMRGLEDLVRAGKILYPAVSNYAAWQTQQALGVQALNGWARLQVIEPMYNLVKRQAEVEILPMAAANRLAVIPYSPLGAGLLSGKYNRSGPSAEATRASSEADEPAENAVGRLQSNNMYQLRYSDDWVMQTAADFVRLCEARGLNPVSTAVAWVGAHPAVTAPIIGARNLTQLADSLASVDVPMTSTLRDEIGALSPIPAPATDRLEEQKKGR